MPWDNMSTWANVEAYDAKTNDNKDDADAIQKALDSGKTTLYFPSGGYKIGKTLHVRRSIRRIIGLESSLEGSGKYVVKFKRANQIGSLHAVFF